MSAHRQADQSTIDDYDGILRVVDLYFSGGEKGDRTKLEQAFHPDARVFGDTGGARLDVPVDRFIQIACDSPVGQGGKYRGRVLSVEQTLDAAVAVVAEDGCWGSVSFVDYLLLARNQGKWKIVSKVFALTGGKIPG
jgi:hypothetical protein